MHERRWRKGAVTGAARRGRRAIVVGALIGSFLLAMTGPAAAVTVNPWSPAASMTFGRGDPTLRLPQSPPRSSSSARSEQ